MTSANQIQKEIESIPDDAVRTVALRLLSHLRNHLSDHHYMWTYAGLAKVAKTRADDSVLHRSIELLSSRPSAKILDMHFLYFDPDEEDPEGEVVCDEDVVQAFKVGYLIDPQDGREIREFTRTLSPFFQISQGVK